MTGIFGRKPKKVHLFTAKRITAIIKDYIEGDNYDTGFDKRFTRLLVAVFDAGFKPSGGLYKDYARLWQILTWVQQKRQLQSAMAEVIGDFMIPFEVSNNMYATESLTPLYDKEWDYYGTSKSTG